MKWDFWFGPDEMDRREAYADEFKPEYQANGDDVQRRISAVVAAYRSDGHPDLPEGYASGWRPAGVNEKTANAAQHSSHLIAAAGDKRDTANGDFAWWCMNHPGVLEQQGVYMEHPVATVIRSFKHAKAYAEEQGVDPASITPTPWCHLSPIAPHSHMRCYFPDASSPGEWDDLIKSGGHAGIDYQGWLALSDRKVQFTQPDAPDDQPRRRFIN